MGGTRFYIGFNTSGSASTNINMRNASFKATTEIHVLIDFSCAANLGGWPRIQESRQVLGRAILKGVPHYHYHAWRKHAGCR